MKRIMLVSLMIMSISSMCLAGGISQSKYVEINKIVKVSGLRPPSSNEDEHQCMYREKYSDEVDYSNELKDRINDLKERCILADLEEQRFPEENDYSVHFIVGIISFLVGSILF